MKRAGARRVTSERSARLSLRASPRQTKLIRAAARTQGKNVTDFVLENACKAAEEVLGSKTEFILPRDRWNAFVKALDRPARHHARLARLLSEKSILERR